MVLRCQKWYKHCSLCEHKFFTEISTYETLEKFVTCRTLRSYITLSAEYLIIIHALISSIFLLFTLIRKQLLCCFDSIFQCLHHATHCSVFRGHISTVSNLIQLNLHVRNASFMIQMVRQTCETLCIYC